MVGSNPSPNLDVIMKVIENMQALTIVQFIKENENPRIGLTMDKVAKAMHERGVCSRPTTLRIIDSLLQAGIILDQKRKENEFHDLVVNDKINFEDLLNRKFRDLVEDVRKGLEPFKSLVKDSKITYKIKDPKKGIEEAVFEI